MLAQTASAEVKLVYPAIDYRGIRSAQVASPADSLCLDFGGTRGGRGLQSAGLKIDSSRRHQRAHGKRAHSRTQNGLVLVSTQRRGQ